MTEENKLREAILELWYEFCDLEVNSDNVKEIGYAIRAKEALLKMAEYLGIKL
jgi:hypothetical protein